MKLVMPLIVFVLLVSISFGQSFSRSVIATAGFDISTNAEKLSYTIGEPITLTFSDDENMYFLTQGFQQSTKFISKIFGDEMYSPQIRLFPNPTRDKISIDFHDSKIENLEIEIFDLYGKKTELKFRNRIFKSENNVVSIDMTSLSTGIYFIGITFQYLGKENKVAYKVVKIY
ncbi:MAG: T9SS type A sorting domain-containing protein [Bacteroidota bacterium]|nr:T9SS type A sorting domain-containing protein [Bacteroidota bacterium]